MKGMREMKGVLLELKQTRWKVVGGMKGMREMKDAEIGLKTIGIIHSPYRDMDEAPFQGRTSPAECVVEVFEDYAEGLKDIEAASHLYISCTGPTAPPVTYYRPPPPGGRRCEASSPAAPLRAPTP